jgi:hypothetical protein
VTRSRDASTCDRGRNGTRELGTGTETETAAEAEAEAETKVETEMEMEMEAETETWPQRPAPLAALWAPAATLQPPSMGAAQLPGTETETETETEPLAEAERETGAEAGAVSEAETEIWIPSPAPLAHTVGHTRDSSSSYHGRTIAAGDGGRDWDGGRDRGGRRDRAVAETGAVAETEVVAEARQETAERFCKREVVGLLGGRPGDLSSHVRHKEGARSPPSCPLLGSRLASWVWGTSWYRGTS